MYVSSYNLHLPDLSKVTWRMCYAKTFKKVKRVRFLDLMLLNAKVSRLLHVEFTCIPVLEIGIGPNQTTFFFLEGTNQHIYDICVCISNINL